MFVIRFYDMAAETSVDAKVPVYLALTKVIKIKNFKKEDCHVFFIQKASFLH